MSALLLIFVSLIVLALLMLYWLVSRFIKCPSDKLLVVYGRVEDGNENGMKVLNGGAAFVWPVIQDYEFIDLVTHDHQISLELQTKDLVAIVISGTIEYGVSNRPDLMNAAASRLLGIDKKSIQLLASNMIQGQLSEVFSAYDIVSLVTSKNQMIDKIAAKVNTALNQIGIEIRTIKINSMNDKEGYMETLKQIYIAKVATNFSIATPETMAEDLAKIDEAIELNAQERQRLISQKIELLVKNKGNK